MKANVFSISASALKVVGLLIPSNAALTKTYSNLFYGVGYDAAAFEAFTDIIQCTGFSCEFFLSVSAFICTFAEQKLI